MSERRITRRRGEAIHVAGPAVIRVSRRVTLIVEAPRATRIERLANPARDQRSADSRPGRPNEPVDARPDRSGPN